MQKIQNEADSRKGVSQAYRRTGTHELPIQICRRFAEAHGSGCPPSRPCDWLLAGQLAGRTGCHRAEEVAGGARPAYRWDSAAGRGYGGVGRGESGSAIHVFGTYLHKGNISGGAALQLLSNPHVFLVYNR